MRRTDLEHRCFQGTCLALPGLLVREGFAHLNEDRTVSANGGHEIHLATIPRFVNKKRPDADAVKP